MENQELKSVEVSVFESYTTYIRKKPLVINISDYPELAGMSEDEIQSYILENGRDMKPMDGDIYENLMEELNNQDIEWDKIDNEDYNIIVE
jgi:hypothetical protein